MNWYALRVLSNHENKIKNYLERPSVREPMGSFFDELIIPSEKYYEKTKDGKKKLIEKKLFPGYIIIKADVTREIVMETIKKTPGIIGFLTYKDGNKMSIPSPLKDREVEQFIGKPVAEETEDIITFIPGETVRITEGPFKTFVGEITHIYSDKKKLILDVKIFGRITPVELDFKEVEKELIKKPV